MRRALLILLALVILLPAAAVVAAMVLLDGDALKLRAADAVRRATGRELTIAGPVRIRWSLTPGIEARDVSLANPPGMSRPALLHAAAVEADIALWPLLSRRAEVRRVVVTAPDLLLERDATGRPNWLLAPPAPPPAAPGPAPEPTGPSARMQVVLGDIEVRDGKLGYRAPALTETLELKRLLLSADHAVKGEAVRNGVVLALNGSAAPGADGIWQYKLDVAGGGATAGFTGNPMQSDGTLTVPDLAAASGLAGRALPPLRDVQVTASFSPAGLANVRLQAGAGILAPGLALVRMSGTAPGLAQPVQVSGEAAWGTLPVQFSVSAGSMAALLGGGPVPVQASVQANDAVLGAQGSVTGLTGRGIDVAVSARVPDLQRLGALAGVALPPLRGAALEARLASAPSGLLLRGLRLSMLQGDVAGDLALGWAPRPSLRGSLVSQRLDLDAWAAGSVPMPPAPAAPAAPPQPAVAPGPAAAPAPPRVIPDFPLPFALLRQADADLRLAVAEAIWHGTTLRAAEGRLLLQDGKLRIDPAGVQGPGGPVQAQVLADATAAPPSLSLTVRAPGLAAGPLFAALGAPGDSAGTVDLDLQLAAAGATTRQLAVALDGHIGLAMVDGEVENRWLAELLGEVFRAANLPFEPGGRSRVRCLALRADVVRGQVKLAALALDSTRLRLDGGGGANLVDETLDLHLRPQVRLGGAGFSAPFKLSGPFRSPKAGLDAGVLAPGRVGVVIGGAAPADSCGPALALARDGRAGPLPAAAPEPARTRPADLLRGLLR